MIAVFVRNSVHNGPMVSHATLSHRSTQAMSFSPNPHPTPSRLPIVTPELRLDHTPPPSVGGGFLA